MQAAGKATTAKTWPTWAGLEQAAHVCNSLAGIALIFQISEGMHPDLLHTAGSHSTIADKLKMTLST